MISSTIFGYWNFTFLQGLIKMQKGFCGRHPLNSP